MGLLDSFFGGNADEAKPGGLLDPRMMMLAGIAQGFGQAGAPSRMPVGLGQALGQGMSGGLGGMMQAHQMQEAEQNNAFRKAQMDELQRRGEAAKQQAGHIEKFAAALPEDQRDLFRAAPEQYLTAHFSKLKDNPFAKIDPKDYTPESITRFNTSRNFADLVKATDPKAANATELTKLLAERNALAPDDPNRALFDAKIKKLTEHAPQVKVDVNNLPPDKRFEWEDKLRADYKGDVKAFREVEDAHRIISGALTNASPANDLAAATKFMKLLDPTSVVRESELAMAISASGLWDRISNYHNVLLQGHKLTPQQREDFKKAADLIYSNVQKKWGEIDGMYDSAAKDYGLDPRRIRMGGGARSQQQAPRVPRYNPATGKIE